MKNYLNVFKWYHLPNRNIRNIWYNIKRFFKSFKYAYQRATKGYCDDDLWDLNTFYTHLFIDSLKALAEANHSYPIYWDDSKWKAELRKIADHFEKSIEDLPNEYEVSEESKLWIDKEIENDKIKKSEFDKGWEALHKVYFDLWD